MNKSLYSASQTNKHWLLDSCLLLLTVGILYFWYLGSYPLFTPDEGRYAEAAREMLSSGDFITPRVDGVPFLDKPILYYWLQTAAIGLFGLKEWAIRFFPFIFGLVGMIATYISARTLYNRATGLMAAAILATTPLYFIGAHYANLDLEVAVLISCSLFCFLHGLRHEQVNPSLLYTAYIFMSLAFLTKGMIAVVLPMLIVGTWLLATKRLVLLSKMQLPIGIAIFLLITAPWYYLVQKNNPEFFNYFFVTQQVTRYLSAADFNNKTPFWFYVPVLMLGFFPWSIFLLQSLYQHIKLTYKYTSQYKDELFLLIWMATIFVFFSIPHSKIITYILPMIPALAILCARTIINYWEVDVNIFNYRATHYFVAGGLILSALLLGLPLFQWIELQYRIQPYLFFMAGALITSCAIALYYRHGFKLQPLILLCLTASALLLLSLKLSANYLNINSTKTLSAHLQPLLKSDDVIVNYNKFYQDLPVYLQRRVAIVADWKNPSIAQKDNWQRELWYGRQFSKDHGWLMNEAKFWQTWNSNKRLFVFMKKSDLVQFKQTAQRYFYVDHDNDTYVMSNKPVILKMLS